MKNIIAMVSREVIIWNMQRLISSIMPNGTRAFLFGSQARGDFSEKSDWDILILLDKAGTLGIKERGDYSFPLYELGANLGIDINPVVYTVSDWEKRRFTPFYKNIINEGISL